MVNETWGTGHEPDRHPHGRAGRNGLPFLPSNTRTHKSSALHPQRCSANRFEASSWFFCRGCIGASAPSRPAWCVGSKPASTGQSLAPMTCPVISRARSTLPGHPLFRSSSSCANPRQRRRRGASSRTLRVELALGAGRSKPSRNCAPSSSHSPSAGDNETLLVAAVCRQRASARVRQEQTMPPIAIDPTLAAALPLAA